MNKCFLWLFGWAAFFAVLVLTVGCVHNAPRNQWQRIEQVMVYGGGGTNGPAGDVTIGAQDMMFEQGDEASGGQGNKTPLTVQTPTQGSAIGAAASEVKGWFGGGGKSTGTATGATSTGTVPTDAADCADGSCEVP